MGKYIESLKILHRDGTETILDPDTNKLVLQGGSFMGLSADPEDNSVTISAGPDLGESNPEWIAKYNALISPGGGSGVCEGVPYNFGGTPYYVSSVSGVFPSDGDLFLTVKQCYHWGLFEYGYYPYVSDPESPVPELGNLQLTDVCPGCVDCGDYDKLYQYMNAIKEALNDKKDRIYLHQPYTPGSFIQPNILELTKQTYLWWNNLCQATAWRCNAIADGNEINAAAMFTNHFCSVIPAGFELVIFFLSVPDRSKAYIIDHTGDCGYEVSAYPDQPTISYPATYVADDGTNTVTINPDDTNAVYPLPTIEPGTWVTLSAPTGGEWAGGAYEVVSGDNNSFVISAPVSAAGSGSTSVGVLVQFKLKTTAPLGIGERVRFYVGAIAPLYVGETGRAQVRFENNLSALGFSGYPDAKVMETNNMVAIDIQDWIEQQ